MCEVLDVELLFECVFDGEWVEWFDGCVMIVFEWKGIVKGCDICDFVY